MKEVTLKVYKFDELSEDIQQKVYNNALEHDFNEDILFLLNNEMKGVLKDFCYRYGIEIQYNIEENDMDYFFIYPNKYFNPFDSGQKVYDFIKKQLDEVKEYITDWSDNNITEPLKRYIEKYDEHRTFESLMKSCLTIFFSNWQKSLRYYNSFEHFKKDAISNELYYFENGKLYVE